MSMSQNISTLNYWRLTAKRPHGLPEVFDLRSARKLKAGDDGDTDICIDSVLIPFSFEFLEMRKNSPYLKLTDETTDSLKGKFEKLKTWKTKLYSGNEFKVEGACTFKLGNVDFSLDEIQAIPLDPVEPIVDPLEKKHFRQSITYSAVGYALLFLITLTISLISSVFKKEEQVAQKITVVDVEKVIKKPIPVQPMPVEEPVPVEKPKEIEKELPAKSNQKPMPKAKQTLKSAPGKTAGSAPRKNINSLGLLAIQTTPGTSRTSLAVANPTVTTQKANVQTSLGLGKAAYGTGMGDGDTHQIAKLGSISGSSYSGGLGRKIENSNIPSIQLSRKEVEVRGALDPAVIRQIIEERLSEIRYCYENALLKNSNLSGKVAATWTIRPDGNVSDITSASEEINSQVLQPCVRSRIQNWKFPSPKGGGIVRVKYPFLFNPVGGAQ